MPIANHHCILLDKSFSFTPTCIAGIGKGPNAAMHRKNVVRLLLWFHACLALPPVAAADAWNRGQTMADAMIDMMGAMGRFSRDYVDSRNRSGDGFSRAWESMTPDNYVTTEPKSPPVSDKTQNTERPNRLPAAASAKTPLEGDWLSRGGERLTIRGSRFRLEAGPDRLLEGVIQIRGRLLALHSPRHRQTWIYEYAEQAGRLALRSTQGPLLLYRRADPQNSRPPEQRH